MKLINLKKNLTSKKIELYPYSTIYLHQMNYNYYKELILKGLTNYMSIASEEEVIISMIQKCEKKFSKVEKLFEIMISLKKNLLTKRLLSENDFDDILAAEEFLMPEHELLPIFKEEPFEIYYNKPIVQFDRFKMNRKSQLFFSKRSFLTLYYSIFIPFQNKNFDEKEDNLNCTLNKNLPDFYKNFN